MVKRWLNVELNKGEESDGFKGFLRQSGIKYETSEAGNLIHFECLMDRVDEEFANDFLDSLQKEGQGT